MTDPYRIAQNAIADLKAAIRQTIGTGPDSGMTNAEIGRTLGIYGGHVGHEGHISRSLLAVMEAEGIVMQDSSSKRWRIRPHGIAEE
jgi:DNA-binding IclR family transcriptional regulator